MSRVLVLTASSATGSAFAGWSGACTGTASCPATMTQAANVAATFDRVSYVLNVSVTGSGTVSSSPAGIAVTVNMYGTGSGTVLMSPGPVPCSSYCVVNQVQNTAITLTAAPASGSICLGWGGACPGTGACSFTNDVPKTVNANFGLP